MPLAFPKDLLIIDFEASLGDAPNTEPVQLGAVLLDKTTLAEKKNFVSWIRADLSSVPPEKLAKKGFDPETILNAPTASEVAGKFVECFGKDYFLASWAAGLDWALFKGLMRSADISPKEFDYHVYDLWPVAYTYLLERGYAGSWRSEVMFQEFGLPSRGAHDALEDCRHAAQVLRKILEK
ncbi:3'-5' exonuclease [Candidatus Falkowbacteria bacterium]|nr:3'-5' exonuclease [Candidatus Falkowbacteria bacterium]